MRKETLIEDMASLDRLIARRRDDLALLESLRAGMEDVLHGRTVPHAQAMAELRAKLAG